MRNTELFNTIADRIENNPESYRQTEWGCGTKFCVAGHVAAELGCVAVGVDSFGKPLWSAVRTLEGRRMATHDFAKEALGLDNDEAYDLFDADWSPVDEDDSVPNALRKIGQGGEV